MLIRLQNITKSYGETEPKVTAINKLDLAIDTNEQVAIMGKSGCGKTTLINVLSTIDYPTEGKYYFDDIEVNNMNEKALAKFRRQQVSIIFQAYNLMPELTVRENILLPLIFDGKKVDSAYLNEIVSALMIHDRLSYFPHQLSGGQQQRVAIARALIMKPAVILADEPTGNLDSKTGQEVISLILTCCKKYGQTLVLVTHDHGIAQHASRLIEMSDGKIIMDKKVMV